MHWFLMHHSNFYSFHVFPSPLPFASVYTFSIIIVEKSVRCLHTSYDFTREIILHTKFAEGVKRIFFSNEIKVKKTSECSFLRAERPYTRICQRVQLKSGKSIILKFLKAQFLPLNRND